MARPKSTKKKIVKTKQSEFVFTLALGKDIYQGTGKTALEALLALPKPAKLTAKGILTISEGEKKKEIMMMPPRLRRLFYHPTFQAIQIKGLVLGMR